MSSNNFWKNKKEKMHLQKENVKTYLFPLLIKHAKRCRSINKSDLIRLGKQQKAEVEWYYYEDMNVVVSIDKQGNFHNKIGFPAYVTKSGDCQFYSDGILVYDDQDHYNKFYYNFVMNMVNSLTMCEETKEMRLKRSVWFDKKN